MRGLVRWLLGLVADVLFGRDSGVRYVSRTNGASGRRVS